jgi:hypothetical protein
MTVDVAMGAAFDRLASRERDAMRAFTPGATPENTDVAGARRTASTEDPLSVVPPEGDYFVVGNRHGGRSYTQDGSLGLRDGELIDQTGRAVLGYAHAGSTLAPIRIDPIDLALHRCVDLHVEADGSVVYGRSAVDPRTGVRADERVVAGRLALARFPAGTQPTIEDASHVGAPVGVVAHVGVAGDGSFGTLAPMRRATSSIDIDASLTKLREAYIALSAIQAARSAGGATVKATMDLLK